ncbi:MAG TPA: hypothetical protein VGS19_01595 [Streptosporangiaceae bacterium]|nr:hypothetical protein [Streptosporangiaceae bacterium]
MDLDTMLAEAAPARHASLDGPDSPAAVALYQRITAAPPPVARPPRRTRFPAVALLTTAAAGLAVAVTLAILPGTTASGPPNARNVRMHPVAWSVTRQPGGLVLVTIRELRDPVGLWRRLRADGVPANVQFLPHNFMATTSVSATPRACRAPHLPDRANALLQDRITPPWGIAELPPGGSGWQHVPGQPSVSWRAGRSSRPGTGAVLAIRPSAIPHGIGLFIKAWAAGPGTRSGSTLSLQTDLVQVSPQCTGS